MAKRRMLLENLIESDDFCSLSHTVQALYIHLNMSADDDGLVGNPYRIMRSLGIPKKNINVLVDTGYVIQFESEVIAITHWLSHNRIKKDRYTPTRYTKEFSTLKIKDDAIYIKGEEGFCGDKTEQIISENEPEVSIGEVSEVKESLIEDRSGNDSQEKTIIDDESKDELRKEKERVDNDSSVFFLYKDKNKEGSSEEDPTENDESISEPVAEGEIKNKKSVTDKFISQLKLYILTTFNTVDDKGFISYYENRGWLDENNKPIVLNYKKHIDEWMRRHP